MKHGADWRALSRCYRMAFVEPDHQKGTDAGALTIFAQAIVAANAFPPDVDRHFRGGTWDSSSAFLGLDSRLRGCWAQT